MAELEDALSKTKSELVQDFYGALDKGLAVNDKLVSQSKELYDAGKVGEATKLLSIAKEQLNNLREIHTSATEFIKRSK